MTLPRRRQPISLERQATVNDAMVPGSFRGRLPVVAPVTPRQRAEARARGIAAVTEVTSRSSQIDTFTLASAGAQDLALTFLPVLESWNVSLNGIAATHGVDYTVSDQTLSLLGPLDARTGDVVQVQYDYLTGVRSEPAEGGTPATPRGVTAGSASSPTLPAGSAAGDFAVIFAAVETSTAIVDLNGYTDHGTVTITHAASSGTYTYITHVLTKTITGSGDVPTLPTGPSVLAAGWGAAVFEGAGTFEQMLTDTVSSGTTGTAPALTAGGTAARFWLTLSNNGTLNDPARFDLKAKADQIDLDVMVSCEDILASVAATSSLTAGWAVVSVGVNG